MKMKYEDIKIRKGWADTRHLTRFHSTPRGKMDYKRSENRKIERNWDQQ